MKKSGKIVIAVVIVAAGALIASRFLKKPAQVEEETRPTVSISHAENRTVTTTTEVIGTLEPAEEVEVMPKMSGEILSVNFEVGDRVQKDQVLITIDSDALDSLKIQADSAKISMDDAQRALARTQALFTTGAVSQQDLESAQSAASSTRLAYENAMTQLNLQKSYTEVKAPISGVIEAKNVDPHDQASVAASIATISGDSGTSITFGVPESVMRNLKTGDSVEIEKNSAELTGTVTEISSKISSSGLYECKASVGAVQPEADGTVPSVDLSSGAKATVTVISEQAADALTVPLSAVSYNDGNPYVYVLEDHKAVKKNLTTGIYDTDYIVVTDGLTPEDDLIVTWSNEIYDGAEVLTEEEAAAGTAGGAAESGSADAAGNEAGSGSADTAGDSAESGSAEESSGAAESGSADAAAESTGAAE